MKISERINILFFFISKSLIESFRLCVRDWCNFPHRAILGFLRALWQQMDDFQRREARRPRSKTTIRDDAFSCIHIAIGT